MSLLVVDASVIIKWFVPEVLSDQAASLLDNEDQFWIPDSAWAETGNIIWKKCRQQELSKSEGLEILAAIQATPLKVYSSESLLESAFEIAHAFNRTVYDSLYLALAVHLDGKMVTADRQHFDAINTTGLSSHISLLDNY